MQADIAEFDRRLEAVGQCDAVVPLRQATMHALQAFGITSAYFLAPLTRDARVGRIVTAIGLPWVWERQYRDRLYLIDPVPDLAMDRLAAIHWPDDLANAALTPKQGRYLAIAAQYGLGRGVGVACFGPEGRSGFLGAVLPPKGDRPDAQVLQRIHTLGQVSFQTYCRIIKRTEDLPALSNRELEVLHWIGRGKSNSVIAELLAISPSSVDVYVRRIFAKLGVADRTTASIKAYAQGLIVSGDYERFVNQSRRDQYAQGGKET